MTEQTSAADAWAQAEARVLEAHRIVMPERTRPNPRPSAPAPQKPSGLQLLRQDFPAHQVGKLPQPMAKRDVMDQLPKAMCPVCHTYHATSKVLHLDYVGHAAVTDRLLDADPEWLWEPLAFGIDGLPAFDEEGGLWIRLTVAGVTRLGYGSAEGKSYSPVGARVKEVIGDAIRNAAMRFGVALALWHKGELHDPKPSDDGNGDDWPPPDAGDGGNGSAPPARAARPERTAKPAAKTAPNKPGQVNEAKIKHLQALIQALKLTDAQLQAMLIRHKVDGVNTNMTLDQFVALNSELTGLRDA